MEQDDHFRIILDQEGQWCIFTGFYLIWYKNLDRLHQVENNRKRDESNGSFP